MKIATERMNVAEYFSEGYSGVADFKIHYGWDRQPQPTVPPNQIDENLFCKGINSQTIKI